MARSLRIPSLRFHKASKQYYVWRNGKRDYLGTDQAIAGERYKQFVSEFVATPDLATTDPAARDRATPAAGITIAEACLLYYRHKQAESKDDALKFRRLSRIKQAVLAASDVCGEMLASQFKGKAFESIQRWLVRRQIKRKASLIEERLGRPTR